MQEKQRKANFYRIAAGFVCCLLLTVLAFGLQRLGGVLLATSEEPGTSPSSATEQTPDPETPGQETPAVETPPPETPSGSDEPRETETPDPATPTPTKTKKPSPSPTLSDIVPPDLGRTPALPNSPTLAPGETPSDTAGASASPSAGVPVLTHNGWSWARVIKALSWLFYGLSALVVLYTIYFIVWRLAMKKDRSLWQTLRKKDEEPEDKTRG